MSLSLRRVAAIMMRHFYLLRGSWARVADLLYWPMVQMVTWGFITQFMQGHSSLVAQAGGLFLGAILLWDLMFRGHLGVAISFMEEMYSRNLGQLFVSPLRPVEFAAALAATGMVRTVLGVLPATLLAIPLYHYSLFSLGPPLAGFFACLMIMAWCTGIAVSGLVMLNGLGAENLAWAAVFALAPVSGIYYPIATLPHWLQPVAWALPSAYVFEGMRVVMFEHRFRADLLAAGLALDGIYLVAAVAVFLHAVRLCRERGRLLQMGE